MRVKYNLFAKLTITVYSIVMSITEKILYILSLFIRKLRNINISHRHIRKCEEKSSKEKVWIHSASLGEAKATLKLISLFSDSKTLPPILLTAVSNSGFNYFRKNAPKDAAVMLMPFDTISQMTRLIKCQNVRKIIIAETEIWPSMIFTASQNNIDIEIFNGRVEEKSFNLYRTFSYIFKPLFSSIKKVYAQNREYADRFIRLGVKEGSVVCAENIKQMITRKTNNRSLAKVNAGIPTNFTVITVANIHPDEVRTVKNAINSILAKNTDCIVVFAPRHIDKSRQIQKQLGQNTVIITRPHEISSHSLSIIATFGIMDELYSISDVVIMGGTYNSVGGHSIWEPLEFAIPVFFGPNYFTQKESYEKAMRAKIAFKAENSEKLSSGICAFLDGETDFNEAVNDFFKKQNSKSIYNELGII